MEQRKLAQLNIKISEKDKIILQKLAAAEGEAMAVVVRRLIRNAVQSALIETEQQEE